MILYRIVVNLFLNTLLKNVARSEFHSSVHEMLKLVKYEDFFLKQMDKWIVQNEHKMEFLKEKLMEFETAREVAIRAGSAHIDSPIEKFQLTKRLTLDWEKIQNMMEHNVGEKSMHKFDKYKNKHILPTDTDLNGAIEGFLRIQYIYRLRTKDMANGVLQGVGYATELDARLCFDIGKFAVADNRLKLGHSWLMEALERYNETINMEVEKNTLKKSTILKAMADVRLKMGDFTGTLELFKQILELESVNDFVLKTREKLLLEALNKHDTKIDYDDEHDPIPVDYTDIVDSERYRYTCNGHITPTSSEERYLRCGYLTETHPFLLLAPIKVEILSHDPMLVLYHDVIAENEIANALQLVDNKIKRATIVGFNGSTISNFRTSQSVFLSTTHHKLLETIDRRVEDMTNLNMRYSEEHQFSNYGIGGHYGQHFDWIDMRINRDNICSIEMGNRIATVLFYLSDVEQGGGTAFPKLKRLLLPKKGSAVFWYNLHASGDPDVRTLHGACPIIVGSKWVQNRWIREYYQDDRRPCELYNDVYEHY